MVMSYMTVADKVMTMGENGIAGKYKDGTPLAARSVSWWNEALHGVSQVYTTSHKLDRPGRCF